MSQNPPPSDAPRPVPDAGGPVLSPLLSGDPPKVGDFWLDGRLTAGPAGVAYFGHGDGNLPVMVILLSEGASGDAAARDRLAGLVNKMHIDTVVARGGEGQDEGRLGHKFRDEDDDPTGPHDAPLAPWVALAYDGSNAAVAEANRILSEIDLSTVGVKGSPSGPDYRLHWIDRVRPGVSRLWPLPWPGRHDRSGWLSILASWLLMLLLGALFVLIAILLFQHAPTETPPPPVPTTATASQSGGSPSPSDGSSPSPSESQSGSPSPSESQQGSPTPNSKL